MDESGTFTLRLIQVECIEAQEFDGDELYITLDDRRVWQARPDKLHHAPRHAGQIRTFHFGDGRKQTKDGWQTVPIDPSAYTFEGLTGEHYIRLWDADRFTRHDLLGENPVSLKDAGHGHIMVVFERDGARYHLIYQVDRS